MIIMVMMKYKHKKQKNLIVISNNHLKLIKKIRISYLHSIKENNNQNRINIKIKNIIKKI